MPARSGHDFDLAGTSAPSSCRTAWRTSVGACNHVDNRHDDIGRLALLINAYTGHAGATAATVRDERHTAVCRGVPRALAADGVSASKERLAERDPCADVNAAAVDGYPEVGELRDQA
jgi:hypothetical protein